MSFEVVVDQLINYDVVSDEVLVFEFLFIWDLGMDFFLKSCVDVVCIVCEMGFFMGVLVLFEGELWCLQLVVDKFFYGLCVNVIEIQWLVMWFGEWMLIIGWLFEEKLMLFWYGHFVIGNSKVRDIWLML